MMLSSVKDFGYEREDKYNEWSYTKEYMDMANAYNSQNKDTELKKAI